MAQVMGNAVRFLKAPPQYSWGVPATNTGAAYKSGEFEYADQTASPTLTAGANGDFGQACHFFRCLICVKAYTAAGTTQSYLYIEAADNAAMTTNNRKLQMTPLPGPTETAGAPTAPGSSANYWSFDLRGVCPDGARQFARPGVKLGTGGSPAITFDAFISAAHPGAAAGDLN